MNADVIPIGTCQSCGRSKVMWEIEVIDPEFGDTFDVYRVCWDCVPDSDDDTWRTHEEQ